MSKRRKIIISVSLAVIVLSAGAFAVGVFYDTFTPDCTGDAATDTATFNSLISTIATWRTATIKVPWTTTQCVVNDLTIPANITLDFASNSTGIFVTTGKTLRLRNQPIAPRSQQIFFNALPGQGIVLLGPDNGGWEIEASPVWWKAGANLGEVDLIDPVHNSQLDAAPAINVAISSGAKNINMQGLWAIGGPILLTQPFTTLDGHNAIGSEIYALKTDISTGIYPNSLFVNLTGAVNITIQNLRLTSVAAYSGWCISAVPGGSGGAETQTYSLRFLNGWVDLGTVGAGFFTGSSTDGFFNLIQFENMKTRFYFHGPKTSATIISNINELHCYDPLVKVASAPNAENIIVSNVLSVGAKRDFLFDIDGLDGFKATDIHYTDFDSPGEIGGLLTARNSTRVTIDDFSINRPVKGKVKGFYVDASQVRISRGEYLGDTSLPSLNYALHLTGEGNDVSINDATISGGFRQVVADGAGGRLTIDHCILEKSMGEAITSTFLVGASTLDVTVQNSEVINGSFGPSGVATDLIAFSTSGRFVFQNNPAVGRVDTANSATTYIYNFQGNGQLVQGGNNIIHAGTIGEINPTAPQPVTYIANNVGGASNRSGPGSPLGSVTPLFIGEEYLNTNGNHWYKAFGLTNTDWSALS